MCAFEKVSGTGGWKLHLKFCCKANPQLGHQPQPHPREHALWAVPTARTPGCDQTPQHRCPSPLSLGGLWSSPLPHDSLLIHTAVQTLLMGRCPGPSLGYKGGGDSCEFPCRSEGWAPLPQEGDSTRSFDMGKSNRITNTNRRIRQRGREPQMSFSILLSLSEPSDLSSPWWMCQAHSENSLTPASSAKSNWVFYLKKAAFIYK